MTMLYHPPRAKADWPIGLVLGVLTAVFLFIAMALAQILGGFEKPDQDTEENLMAYVPPQVEEIEEEEPPPEEEEAPEPEFEPEPPQISLDQLEVALNPGTGSLAPAGFSMPEIGTSQKDLGTEDMFDFSDLDQPPEMTDRSPLNVPSRLKNKYDVSGRIQLFLVIDENGRVIESRPQDYDVPDEVAQFVAEAIAKRRFTPPQVQGRPVKAKAVIPIPIKL